MYKLISNFGGIFYIENEETLEIILSDGGRLMTNDEIDRHENPTKYWTPEQIAEHNRSQMPNLTPIEFDVKLIDAGLYDQVQDLIAQDLKLKVAYTRATFFSRTDPVVEQARIALNLTDEQVDEIWTS